MAMPQILRGNKGDTAMLCRDNECKISTFVPTQTPEDPPERLDKTLLPNSPVAPTLDKIYTSGLDALLPSQKKKVSQSGFPDLDVGTFHAAANSHDVFRSGVPPPTKSLPTSYFSSTHLSCWMVC